MSTLSCSQTTGNWKPTAKDKARAQLQALLELFKSGNVPDAIAVATIPPYECPSNKWSLSNRLLMLLAGTGDARGFRQWKEAGRHVKKGSRCFYILGRRIDLLRDAPHSGANLGQCQRQRVFVRGHA